MDEEGGSPTGGVRKTWSRLASRGGTLRASLSTPIGRFDQFVKDVGEFVRAPVPTEEKHTPARGSTRTPLRPSDLAGNGSASPEGPAPGRN
jgi:hypothetical protein